MMKSINDKKFIQLLVENKHPEIISMVERGFDVNQPLIGELTVVALTFILKDIKDATCNIIWENANFATLIKLDKNDIALLKDIATGEIYQSVLSLAENDERHSIDALFLASRIGYNKFNKLLGYYPIVQLSSSQRSLASNEETYHDIVAEWLLILIKNEILLYVHLSRPPRNHTQYSKTIDELRDNIKDARHAIRSCLSAGYQFSATNYKTNQLLSDIIHNRAGDRQRIDHQLYQNYEQCFINQRAISELSLPHGLSVRHMFALFVDVDNQNKCDDTTNSGQNTHSHFTYYYEEMIFRDIRLEDFQHRDNFDMMAIHYYLFRSSTLSHRNMSSIYNLIYIHAMPAMGLLHSLTIPYKARELFHSAKWPPEVNHPLLHSLRWQFILSNPVKVAQRIIDFIQEPPCLPSPDITGVDINEITLTECVKYGQTLIGSLGEGTMLPELISLVYLLNSETLITQDYEVKEPFHIITESKTKLIEYCTLIQYALIHHYDRMVNKLWSDSVNKKGTFSLNYSFLSNAPVPPISFNIRFININTISLACTQFKPLHKMSRAERSQRYLNSSFNMTVNKHYFYETALRHFKSMLEKKAEGNSKNSDIVTYLHFRNITVAHYLALFGIADKELLLEYFRLGLDPFIKDDAGNYPVQYKNYNVSPYYKYQHSLLTTNDTWVENSCFVSVFKEYFLKNPSEHSYQVRVKMAIFAHDLNLKKLLEQLIGTRKKKYKLILYAIEYNKDNFLDLLYSRDPKSLVDPELLREKKIIKYISMYAARRGYVSFYHSLVSQDPICLDESIYKSAHPSILALLNYRPGRKEKTFYERFRNKTSWSKKDSSYIKSYWLDYQEHQ